MNDISRHSSQFKQQINKISDSPEMVADYIADVFQCPITIEDSNHHVISYSKHRENIDKARVSTIMNRKVPDKVINGLWKKGFMPKLIDSDEPIIIPEIEEIGLGNRVAVSIRKKDEILGFIWAHTADKKLHSEELMFLKEAATQMKSFFLRQHQSSQKSEARYTDFFWKLITGGITETNSILQKAKQFQINLDGSLAIAIIQFPEDITERVTMHAYYLAETQVNVNIAARLFDDKNFILIVRLKKHHNATESIRQFIQQFIEKINSQLRIKGINGASGCIYEQPGQLKASYEQALKVIDTKRKFPKETSGFIAYEELGVYKFIDDLMAVKNQASYHKPHIERLRTYDAQHNTSLLTTLYEYLQADSNPPEAAKKLFIHANTMNYRLKRIREIADIDLTNPSQKTAFYLELLIDDL